MVANASSVLSCVIMRVTACLLVLKIKNKNKILNLALEVNIAGKFFINGIQLPMLWCYG